MWSRQSLRSLLALAACALSMTTVAGVDGPPRARDAKRPAFSLKASPAISFSPARIFLTAELKGRADDSEAYYCPTVEWDWGDGTRSESTADCDPYEADKSTIQRRFLVEHVYRTAGNYRIQVRLKKKDKVIAAASATVQVRAGLRDSPIGSPSSTRLDH